MVAGLEAGFRLGARDGRRTGAHDGLGAIEAALFALLGLLLGFAFAGATSRLDARRELIVREANAIGTAYLRVDLLPQAAQPGVRTLFRRYLAARLRAFDQGLDSETLTRASAEAATLQQQIWTAAMAARGIDASGDRAFAGERAGGRLCDDGTGSSQRPARAPLRGRRLAHDQRRARSRQPTPRVDSPRRR
jgi:hypothetical protein